jgi:Mg2+ and Co2+ transporter CorA
VTPRDGLTWMVIGALFLLVGACHGYIRRKAKE